MANYNVQMKQFNGTSFDNILPHAYLADKATDADHATSADSANTATILDGGGGATEIITTARSGLSQIATGSYVGNGTVGESNAITIQCGFNPKFLWVYRAPIYRLTTGSAGLINLGTMVASQGVVGDSSHAAVSQSWFWVNGDETSVVQVKIKPNSKVETYWRINFSPLSDSIKFYATVEDTSEHTGPSSSVEPWMQLNISNGLYHWVAIGETTT